ncbi:Gfo/Idh/MocA family protein [Rhizosphaericola mali]|uniref:Gfo/Idh/MocA family oxidoreductase n=1 Tax=Rhizosphaericola mali TaxID=2545455 RepID=A0A5P2GFG6_9BACT|nr:Gfo/Idh/MocA family oxidoreductase [Rhizosphaericola mali]QES90361.1 Gfo/Idh/MocA family oxidoreductase [Rhizosphaericola mali]
MSELRFAIIGFGNIGSKHYEHIINNQNARLIAVCDIDERKKGKIHHPNILFFNNLTNMLDIIEIDILCICTPNYLHYEHAILALNRNKHVVIEKPMALKKTDCDSLIALANAKQKQIFTVMQNRFSSTIQFVKELISNNHLGKIYQIHVNCFWNRNEKYYSTSNWRGIKDKDGGVLYTQFSHFVDLLYYLHGDIEIYNYGTIKNYNHAYINIEDSGSFIMTSKKGSIINFNYSTCSFNENMESSFTIIAEFGSLKIGGQYCNTIEYLNLQDKNILYPKLEKISANDYGNYKGSANNHDKVINNVINVLLAKETIMSDALDGMHVVNIIENMYNIVQP